MLLTKGVYCAIIVANNNLGETKMRFLYTALVGLFAVLFLGSPVLAQNYVEPTFEGLIDVAYTDGLIDLANDEQFTDYMRLKDCNTYKENMGDDFKWQTVRKTWQDKADEDSQTINRQFKVLSNLEVTNYNFETLAFDLDTNSQLKNATYLHLFTATNAVCDSVVSAVLGLKGLPTGFQIELDMPFSMYRLPMGQAMGKRILEELEKESDTSKKRKIYLTTYVTLDAMDRIIRTNTGAKVAIAMGRLERIDFFVDQARTRRFKTLYPNQD